MQISVSGKGINVGESLIEHCEGNIEQNLSKYSDRITNVEAVISKESHNFRADIHGHLGTHAGVVVRAHALAGDAHSAFDAALEKAEKQLRRYKRKITNHHKVSMGGAEAEGPIKGTKYVLSPDAGEHDDQDAFAASGVIIAEKPTDISTLTVSQAVMVMDLQDLPAVMFYNASHGRLNVVYRRADGNISWVDPAEDAKKGKGKAA